VLKANPESKDARNSRDLQKLVAEVYARIGQAGKATDLLDRLVLSPYGLVAGPTLPYDPAWDAVRDDPRFLALVPETRPTPTPLPTKPP